MSPLWFQSLALWKYVSTSSVSFTVNSLQSACCLDLFTETKLPRDVSRGWPSLCQIHWTCFSPYLTKLPLHSVSLLFSPSWEAIPALALASVSACSPACDYLSLLWWLLFLSLLFKYWYSQGSLSSSLFSSKSNILPGSLHLTCMASVTAYVLITPKFLSWASHLYFQEVLVSLARGPIISKMRYAQSWTHPFLFLYGPFRSHVLLLKTASLLS